LNSVPKPAEHSALRTPNSALETALFLNSFWDAARFPVTCHVSLVTFLAKLKATNTKDERFEDVVKSAQDAAVLVLIY
jgi:hypothetical protein